MENKKKTALYTKVLILICTFLPSQMNPLWINLNKSQQEVNLVEEVILNEWITCIVVVFLNKKKKQEKVLRVVARNEVDSSTFSFYCWVIQAQTCSQDFNTTRPFPILWEQKK